MTLSLTAENREEARKILHEQGYSIIEIQEVMNASLLEEGNFFYFDILNNGVLQTGKIQSNDIFKAYRKLIEDLRYNVVAIYTSPDISEEEKKIITLKVRDGYNMYLESIGKKLEDEKKDETGDKWLEDFSPQLLKEVEKYSKIIDETIVKIQNLLIKNHEIITTEQKSILDRVEMELVSIRGIKNIGKIQTTLEESLKTIGAIELELLKKWMIKEKAKFLAETNKLLQGVGSNEKIQTEEEKKATLSYKIQDFFKKLGKEKPQKIPSNQAKIDKNTFIYFKNKRELDIYKKAHQKNDWALLKALFTWKIKLFKRLLLKRRLLLQNIQIIENRLQNRTVSYTKLVHGVDYYIQSFFLTISFLGTIFSIALFWYVIVFIFANTANNLWFLQISISNKSPLFLTIFSLFVAFLVSIRGWKITIIGIIIFLSICSFLLTNF